MDAIQRAGARWQSGSDLEAVLEKFGGDIVQAIQALKESKPKTTAALEEQIFALWTSLKECHDYCQNAQPEPLTYPFLRPYRQVKDVLGYLYPESTRISSVTEISKTQISVGLPKQDIVEKFALGPHQVPRLFNGLWQLSSPAWGSGTAEKQEVALTHLIECGLTATDMADHYVSSRFHL